VSAESLHAGNPFDVRIHRGANEIGGKRVELRRGPDIRAPDIVDLRAAVAVV